jgi:DNA-binding CsgD family transcriptional regulator
MYELATVEHVFGGALLAVSLALTVPGNGLLVLMICVIACEVVSLSVSPLRRVVHIVLAITAAALGLAKEIFPQRVFLFLNSTWLTGILAYAVVVIARRTHAIRHPRLLSLVRSTVAGAEVMVAVVVVQWIGQATHFAPQFLSRFPLVQILFYLAIVGLLLFHAAQYLFQQEILVSYRLPEQIVKQFRISPREQEIITMLVQGFPNRVIGEKLFISTTTVKNHIYHIYQKTGITNKIQLINLINSLK